MADKNLTGVTGEYFVCAELGKQGILALLTPKNNPLFDIVATSPETGRTVWIQVKTMALENKQGFLLNKSVCEKKKNDNLYTVLVNLKVDKNEYFIYKYDELAELVSNNYKRYLSIPKRDGDPRKDTQRRWHDFRDFTQEDWNRKNNWSLLGF
ncbi:aspartate-ammonia lyase [Bacillus sp. 31A1R]|uniref:Aspartate-ammonia lyase n=1 Tax=Robertmurraya mangrovi TaxID=3098077 RepID=A0ABU5ITD1_9BACI|nr:aspartate-ammonia lyase [Bacillus sp. 31A1R]MDZ5470417.1 aspartate-ammonia lyase [Bacillus sp. 31A1R]